MVSVFEMAADEPQSATKPTNVRYRVFTLAFVTSWLLYLHRYVFAFIKPTLSREWGLSNTELGRLDSAFSLCYTLFQIPLAIVADAAGVHLVLTSLMLIWCGGLALVAWAPSVKVIWFGQALLGTGQSAVYACLNRISRLWFAPAVRTTLQGAVGILAGRLGALSSALVFSTLLLGVLKLDWRTAIGILVAVGIVHLMTFATVFRNTPREHRAVNDAEARLIEGADSSAIGLATQARRPSVRTLLRSMTPRSLLNLMSLSLQTLLSTFADNIYSNWIPLFLSQVHHLEFKKMGIFAALPLLGGAIAGVLGGALNDYGIARTGNRRWSRAGVAMAGKGIAAILMFAAGIFYDRPYVFCMFLFFIKLCGDCSLTSSWGVVADIGGRATASVFAVQNSVAGLGLIAAPIIFGYVADHYGWQLVFISVGATYVLCALSWLIIDCTIPVVSELTPDESIDAESTL